MAKDPKDLPAPDVAVDVGAMAMAAQELVALAARQPLPDGNGNSPAHGAEHCKPGVGYVKITEGFVAAGYRWTANTYLPIAQFEQLAPGQLTARMENGFVELQTLPVTA